MDAISIEMEPYTYKHATCVEFAVYYPKTPKNIKLTPSLN